MSLEDGVSERVGEGGACGLSLLNEEAAEPFLLLSNNTPPPCLRASKRAEGAESASSGSYRDLFRLFPLFP